MWNNAWNKIKYLWNKRERIIGNEEGWVGLAIVAAATYLSARQQSKAAKQAAQAGAGAATSATQAQLQMFQQTQKNMAPWLQAGKGALNQLTTMMQAGPGQFVPSQQPGYKFGYQQFVQKPTLAMASATGGLGGGGTQKALTRYASNYATQNYQNWLNNWYRSLTPYQSMAGLGQTTAGQMGQNALATGQMMGQNIMGAGSARATGYINQGNIYGNMISGLGQNALNYYMYNKYGGQPSSGGYSSNYVPPGSGYVPSR